MARSPIYTGILTLALGVVVATPASAQEQRDGIRGAAKTVGDVVMTPLSDLNLRKEPIPDVLQDAATAPYASEKLISCDAIAEEIERLTTVLGPEIELTDGDRGIGGDIAKAAKGVVGGLIPFRGIVRQVSGAAKREREFQTAIYAGAVRRGFLKGLGRERGCDYPARPATKEERDAFAEDGEIVTEPADTEPTE